METCCDEMFIPTHTCTHRSGRFQLQLRVHTKNADSGCQMHMWISGTWLRAHGQTHTDKMWDAQTQRCILIFLLLFHCWWGPAAMLRFSAACCNKGQKQCTVVIKTNRWLIVFQRVWFSPTDHLSHLSSVELQGYNQHACETSARLNMWICWLPSCTAEVIKNT